MERGGPRHHDDPGWDPGGDATGWVAGRALHLSCEAQAEVTKHLSHNNHYEKKAHIPLIYQAYLDTCEQFSNHNI